MERGDLILCTWQPRSRCSYTLKGQTGIVLETNDGRSKILFPQYAAYTHWLAYNVLKVISEGH